MQKGRLLILSDMNMGLLYDNKYLKIKLKIQ